MYSPSQSNTQYDQPATQTQPMDDFPEEDFEGGIEQDQCWGQLISRSVDGPHIDLQTIPPDEQGRFNLHLLGRSNQCILQLNSSPRISNKHCIIYCKQNIADPNNPRLEAWIEDLSANGTYINGETRLTKNVPRLLHHRDEIFLVNPEFKRMAKAGTKILEDIVQNSFVVMLNLPSPVDEFIQASRDYDLQLSQNENLSQNNNKIERTSTVNRLLGQNRCIYDYYEIKTLLGEGTSGSVYHGINKETGKDWAVKIIPIKNLNLLSNNGNKNNKNIKIMENELTKEAEMLRSLRHMNIIHLEDIFSDLKRLFLVMEISSGGDLFDRIIKKKNYAEMEAKIVMNQILQAIYYLHERNIAHRDIKPENILLISKHSDVHIKLTDFGLAKKLDESGRMKTFCGTPQYFAPEVLQRRNTTKGNGTYSLAADMWSIGVIMFVLLEGNYPFNENNLSQQIAMAQYSFAAPVWRSITDEAKGLIRSLLVTDPSVRLTAKQALDHAWFTCMSSTNTTTDDAVTAVNGSSNHSVQAVPDSSNDVSETAMQVASSTASAESKDASADASTAVNIATAAVRSETVNTSVTDATVVAMINPPISPTTAAFPLTQKKAEQSVNDTNNKLAAASTSCMSVSSSMQAGMERVNLDPAGATDPDLAVSSSPSTIKSSGRGKRRTTAVATTTSTGKRKLIANTNSNITSASLGRINGQKTKQTKTTHSSPVSDSKEARVMENYFIKQSPAVITRRVTRSSSSTLNHKN